MHKSWYIWIGLLCVCLFVPTCGDDGEAPENTAPVANDDSITTPQDTAVNIDVLANDSDPDGDAISVSDLTDPENGAVSENADGTVAYTPGAGFFGSDSFGYTISDGRGGTDTAQVLVTVSEDETGPDGTACADDGECESGHCQNGFCCNAGDCCAEVADCPDTYSEAPVCDDDPTCQGTRVDASCVAFVCESSTMDDDTACGTTVMAIDCDPFDPIYCTGEEDQTEPSCTNTCVEDTDCPDGLHCDDDACVDDLADGEVCDEDSDCVAGYCGNGFCCAAGDCCVEVLDCPETYSSDPVCDDTTTCQGTRVDAECVDHQCASTDPIEDDTGCGTDVQAKDCDPYLPVFCNGEEVQAEPMCGPACTDDSDCLAGFHCDDTCQADLDNGFSCDEDSDCISAHCQNGFCCTAGDCCAAEADCPSSYGQDPVCDDAPTCQGTRVLPACVDNMCGAGTDPSDDDSACDATVVALDCTPFGPVMCNGDPDQAAPSCPTTCTQDTDCVAGYHCDVTCEADVVDGGTCDEDSDCVSGHCQNDVCCSAGDCCATPADCPGSYGQPPQCDDNVTCQGTRIDAACTNFVCAAGSTPTDDDSACDASVMSKDCDPYLPVSCTGDVDQTEPLCPTSCTSDSECIAGFHCDDDCFADLPDGDVCDEDSDCISGLCQNGFCCTAGDCCATANHCPASYWTLPQCDDAVTCQGTRVDAECNNNICEVGPVLDDDTGCDTGTLSKDCTPYAWQYCTGEEVQSEPVCGTLCFYDEECHTGYHCDGTCEADRPNGWVCNEDSDCESGHCQNLHCCDAGDCCAQPSDCPGSYSTAPQCDDVANCQGTRIDAVCVDFQCGVGGSTVADDSGCAGLLANDCGLHADQFCTGAQTQSPPVCPIPCNSNTDCDPGATCIGGTCFSGGAQGDPCLVTGDCLPGLQCADGVCCTSSCPGECLACNVQGNLGTCTPIPAGQDPDDECGALDCSAYYFGWLGDDCYDRADVPASAATCDGGGSCYTAAALCPSQGQGGVASSCDPVCQNPMLGTCSGATPGDCNNLNLGNHSCGEGECYNAVPRCIDGQQNPCVPLDPNPEQCNNRDDDCDGVTDWYVSSAVDSLSNNCSNANYLGVIPQNWPVTSVAYYIYPQGDEDWFYVLFVDNEQGCIFPLFPQFLEARVGLRPPFSDCTNYDLEGYTNSCGVVGGSYGSSCVSEGVVIRWVGICNVSNDSRYYRFRVFPATPSEWECKEYVVTLDFTNY